MKKPSFVTILFASLATLAIGSAPNPALAQRRGHGSHGGGFHGGGLHGGSHGHSFHGLGGHFGGGGHAHIFGSGRQFHGGGHQFHNGGGGRGFFSGKGFHGSDRGNFSRRNFGSGMYSGRTSSRGFSATPFNNSRRAFSSEMFRSSGSVVSRQWRSFGGSRFASFGRPAGASAFGEGAGWHSFGNRENSFASAQGESHPWQGSGWRSWGGPGERTSVRESGWTAFSRGSASRWEPGRFGNSRAFAGTRPGGRSSAISIDRVLSNFETRFSHSPARRFSFADSRFGSRSFGRSGFGDRHGFYGGERGFGDGEFWSGDNGGGYSLLPDLFGLAFDFGGLAVRGLNLLGGAGLNLLASALSGDTGYGGAGYGGAGYGSYEGFGGYGGYSVGFAPAPPLVPLIPVSPYWTPVPTLFAPPGGVFFPR